MRPRCGCRGRVGTSRRVQLTFAALPLCGFAVLGPRSVGSLAGARDDGRCVLAALRFWERRAGAGLSADREARLVRDELARLAIDAIDARRGRSVLAPVEQRVDLVGI